MAFSTIGPVETKASEKLDKVRKPSLSEQKRVEAMRDAKEHSKRFVLKNRFETLVRAGTPPTNAAIQVGLKLPAAQVYSTNEVLDFIDKGKYMGKQKRR